MMEKDWTVNDSSLLSHTYAERNQRHDRVRDSERLSLTWSSFSSSHRLAVNQSVLEVPAEGWEEESTSRSRQPLVGRNLDLLLSSSTSKDWLTLARLASNKQPKKAERKRTSKTNAFFGC